MCAAGSSVTRTHDRTSTRYTAAAVYVGAPDNLNVRVTTANDSNSHFGDTLVITHALDQLAAVPGSDAPHETARFGNVIVIVSQPARNNAA